MNYAYCSKIKTSIASMTGPGISCFYMLLFLFFKGLQPALQQYEEKRAAVGKGQQ